MSGDLGNSYNIDIWGLLIALGMVAVAAIISELMHMGIGKTLMWSSCRALVQLCAMGFIIGYVIRSNSVWMVFALMAVMLVAAVQIVMSRARGIPKGLAGPIFLSLVITMLLMLALVTELIVRPHPWYAPQLVVPLTGMLLGNTVTALAVGLSRFYESMEAVAHMHVLYCYILRQIQIYRSQVPYSLYAGVYHSVGHQLSFC